MYLDSLSLGFRSVACDLLTAGDSSRKHPPSNRIDQDMPFPLEWPESNDRYCGSTKVPFPCLKWKIFQKTNSVSYLMKSTKGFT